MQYKKIRVVLFVLLVLIIGYTSISKIKGKEEVDFEKIYSQSEYLMYEEPKGVNTEAYGVKFYKPQGYKLKINDGIFLKNIYSTIEVIPQKISADAINKNYKINVEDDIVFQKDDSTTDTEFYSKMIAWDIGDMYEILIVDKNNNAVVGDIKKEHTYEGANDMVEILNSVRLV